MFSASELHTDPSERDAVVAIELVTPNDMSILLLRVQSNIEDCEC